MGPTAAVRSRTQAMRRTLRSALSMALCWLAVLAIGYQSIVLQSHIHVVSLAGWEQSGAVADASAGSSEDRQPDGSGKAPGDSDPSHCFICRQITLAGAAVLPPASAPVLIEQTLVAEAPVTQVFAVRTISSHAWRSRAPPIQL